VLRSNSYLESDVTLGTYLYEEFDSEKPCPYYNYTTMVFKIDVRELPANLSSAYILSFLVHHDWDDLSPALTDSDQKSLAPNQSGTINLNVAAKSFTIKLPTVNNRSTWTFQRSGSE